MTGKYLSTAIALVLCLGAGAAQAGSVVLVNVDPVGSGLNDTTPATPVGANPGVTVGEQRRIAYQFAGDLWGAVLVSAVPIKVQASFAALSCTANAGTLGSAGPSTAFYNFNRAPQLDTWYHSALADAISGVDLANGNGVDIVSRFNANLGKPDCLASQKWYYGLDGVTPAGSVNFLDVVMHEIGHGLGFSSFVNKATGALMQGKSDAFSTPVFDNRSGLSWVAMTDAQRSAAIVGGGLVFTGASAKAEAPLFLSERLSLKASGTLAANYEFGTASFGPEATSLNFNAAAVVVNDGTATGSRGCRQLTNAASVANKIAVADAGGCISGDKAFYAELAGAIGIIIVNNVAGPAPNVADGYSNNNIPTVTLSQTDGSALKAAVPGVTAALAKIAGQYQGTDGLGRPKLFAPPVLQGGSSLSHYDASLTPNALMEAVQTGTEDANLMIDLTPALFRDIGWPIATGNARIGATCASGVDAVSPGGAIVGASINARAKVCKLHPGLLGVDYINCVNAYASKLQQAGLITGLQQTQIALCATATALLPL